LGYIPLFTPTAWLIRFDLELNHEIPCHCQRLRASAARTMMTTNAPVTAHTLTVEAVSSVMEVRLDVGLTSAQAPQRLTRHSPNRLPETAPRSPWRVLLGQFKSILIVILIGAAALAALVGNIKDAVVILAVVVINALVGFYQYYSNLYNCIRALATCQSLLKPSPVVSAGLLSLDQKY
jgi:magnesium-transporting ATPase (P-type)